jgi:hypothetical protein
MYFKPIDEISLRHLFSSRLGEETLKMTYLGPVLNTAGIAEENPDCLILDRRKEKPRILRCEFKYAPCSKEEFKHNGVFDVAIVWSIRAPLSKQILEQELNSQNRCQEIVVMSEEPNFADLADYHLPNEAEFYGIEQLRHVLLCSVKFKACPVAFAAYIASIRYPKGFEMKRMVSLLSDEFPEVRKAHVRGRHNVVSKLLQTEPPLIERLFSGMYRWNDAIVNADRAAPIIGELIRTKFDRTVPSSELISKYLH